MIWSQRSFVRFNLGAGSSSWTPISPKWVFSSDLHPSCTLAVPNQSPQRIVHWCLNVFPPPFALEERALCVRYTPRLRLCFLYLKKNFIINKTSFGASLDYVFLIYIILWWCETFKCEIYTKKHQKSRWCFSQHCNWRLAGSSWWFMEKCLC